MTPNEAIKMLAREAFGHTHTATPEWYAACAMGVDALIEQQERNEKGDINHGKINRG